MGLLKWLFGTVATAGDIDGPGFFHVGVVGESNYQRAIQQARKGAAKGTTVQTQATLVLEDNNPHDKQAVRVDIAGRTVGYLDRDNARAYRKELNRNGHSDITTTCAAKIIGGKPRPDGSAGMYGVFLDLPAVD